jgi:hypothetical protein
MQSVISYIGLIISRVTFVSFHLFLEPQHQVQSDSLHCETGGGMIRQV